MEQLADWNDQPIHIARSKRDKVIAVADWERNVIRTGVQPWPPAPLVQKLYESRQKRAFVDEDLSGLSAALGVYSDLQSMHSEDALTWSFFGPVAWAEEATRTAWLNWLTNTIGVHTPAPNEHCSIDLWRRVPHPDTSVPGGPELDLFVSGDQVVVFGEAKWRSSEGTKQGKNKTKSQLQLRREWLSKYGTRLYPGRTLVVLGVVRDQAMEVDVSDNPPVLTRPTTWSELAKCPHHPVRAEVDRYLAWKEQHSLA